jgi:hypothetical protein
MPAHSLILMSNGTYELRIPDAHHLSYHDSMTAAYLMLMFVSGYAPSLSLH